MHVINLDRQEDFQLDISILKTKEDKACAIINALEFAYSRQSSVASRFVKFSIMVDHINKAAALKTILDII